MHAGAYCSLSSRRPKVGITYSLVFDESLQGYESIQDALEGTALDRGTCLRRGSSNSSD
jgi:hypothetical protein